MSAVAIQQGVIGLTFRRTAREAQTGAVIDLSSSSSRTFILKDPNGNVTTKSATLSGSNAAEFTTSSASDFGAAGPWEYQLEYVNSSGTYKSLVDGVLVKPNLR